MRILLCLGLLLYVGLTTNAFAQQQAFASNFKTTTATTAHFSEGNCPTDMLGKPCSDGDDCTVNDVYDANCNCLGILKDVNENNICDADEEASSAGFNVGAELVSRYVWRGLAYSSAPSFQPTLSYAFEKNDFGFEVGTWASYSFNGRGSNEADLYLMASYGPVGIGFTDYFYPFDDVASHNYFDYSKDNTGHTFEAQLYFDGVKKFPLTAMLAHNFYGENPNSFYAELSYPITDQLSATVGAGNGFYTLEDDPTNDVFSVSLVSLTYERSIKLSKKLKLPIGGSLMFNPNAEKIYVVLTVGLFEND